MAEVGFIASIITLAGAGATVAISLHDIAHRIGSAAGDFKRVAIEISTFSQVLSTVSRVVTSDASDAEATIEVVQNVVGLCENAIGDADSLLGRVRSLLSKQRSRNRAQLAERIRWLFMKSRVDLLRNSIESLKATLTLLIATLDYAEASHRRKSAKIRNALKLQMQSLVIGATDAADTLLDAAKHNQPALETKLSTSGNSRLLENAGDDRRDSKTVSGSFSQIQSSSEEEEAEEEDSDEDAAEDEISEKEGAEPRDYEAQRMVCQLARRITKRLNDQGYRKSAVPNPSWDDSSPPATQSDPLSSSRRDTSLRPEPDVDETSSKLADVNTKLASLEAWLREQLPRQEAERNEKRTSISGDEELLSQLRKLFSIPGSLDATKEPFSQVPHAPGDRDLLSQLRKLLSIGTSSNLFAHTLGQAPVRSADQDLHALLRRLLDPDRVATASDGPGFALRAAPEEKQAPIRFQDAIGRKFNFPFHLCKNWKGMEELIRQAFQHVEEIGPHVCKGHYDLMGPDAGIIIPSAWDMTIEPDMTIVMQLWPLPEPKEQPIPPPLDDVGILSLDDLLGPEKEVKGRARSKALKKTSRPSGFGSWMLGATNSPGPARR